MSSKPARKHHYVPRFVLEPWAINDDLHGYHWDKYKQDVCCQRRGVKAFCRQLDLLSLKTPRVPSDALEREFFGHVDDRGAKVAAKLVQNGPAVLTPEERSDFGRLLLSLEARRPGNVSFFKEIGASHFKDGLDNDPEILDAFKREGIDKKPSEFLQYATDVSLEDHALLMIQRIVDNPKVGQVLINAHWRVYHLGSGDGTFVLSDRPLICKKGYDQPDTLWALPLSPSALFVASRAPSVIQKFDRQTPLQIRKKNEPIQS